MKAVLQFIKTYLISLICGVVAIGAVAFGVMGMSSDDVRQEMKSEIQRVGAANIKSLRVSAKNAEVIEAEKRRGKLFEDEYNKTLAEANRINRREVLMKGVFPTPERAATSFRFKEKYARRMKVLHTELSADTLPTEAERQEEVLNVEDLIALDLEREIEGKADEPGRTVRAAPRGRAPTASVGSRFGGPSDPMGMRGASSPRGGGKPTDDPKYDPVYRARVAKAKSILCYYDEATFHVAPLAYDTASPSSGQMWAAQVGLWIQEDVVKAIAELNGAAADAVVDEDPCVQHVPVKRLVSVRVRGYEADAVPPPPGRSGDSEVFNPRQFPVAAGGEASKGGASLTDRKSNDQYDVIRFSVTAAVDQRKILQVVDAITRVSFYQCLKVSYDTVDLEELRGQGYFYGTDPVVYATYEFEGYMFRDIYKELMPDAVKQALGIAVDEE